jgi:cobalamin biosynthesis Mg chelatase CobN
MTMATSDDSTATPPDDPDQIRAEIEHTRQQLGETVDALVAKTDVKSRARAEAGAFKARLQNAASQGKARAAAQAAKARDKVSATTAGARHAAPGPQQAAKAKETAGKAVSAARQHPGPLSAALGVLAAAFLAIWLRRKR